MVAVIPKRDIAAGLGDINPDALITEAQIEREKLKSSHYVYFPLGSPPVSEDIRPGHEHYGDLYIGDRRTLHRQWIRRAVVEEFRSFAYWERDQTNEALDKENAEDVDEFSPWLMLAGEQAHELFVAYNSRLDPRGLSILHSITGTPADIVTKLAKLILPETPDTIIKIVKELKHAAAARVAAIHDVRLKDIASKLLEEMQRAANAGHAYAVAYIQRTEAEQIARSTPNGFGKLQIDSADLYYYAQLEREPANPAGSMLEVARSQEAAEQAPKEPEMKECPRCYELIRFKTLYCRYCELDLNPQPEKKDKK